MYIEPSTIIKFYKNMPMDNTYTNTLYFNSISEQNAFFHTPSSNLLASLTAQSYQRHSLGKLRVQLKTEILYACNYIAFQNANFGSKWFYAFVTNIEYVNNEVCEVTYEIDYIQSWLLNVKFKECYVEREHSLTDNIGDNIIDENLPVGEYIYPKNEWAGLNDLATVIGVSDIDKGWKGGAYGSVYCGAKLWAFEEGSSMEQNIETFLSGFDTHPEKVLMMYMCPNLIIPRQDVDTNRVDLTRPVNFVKVYDAPSKTTDKFGNYTPKNNKLYTYPFNFIRVSNGCGSVLDLRYEFFKEHKPAFCFTGSFLPPVSVTCTPTEYKGKFIDPNGWTPITKWSLLTESISINNFPQCMWATSSYDNWLQTAGVSSILGNTTSTAKTLGVMSTLGDVKKNISPFGEVMAMTQLFDTGLEVYNARDDSDIIRGDINAGSTLVQHNALDFEISRCCVNEQYARIIDEYFTMYGYPVKRVKYPTYNNRPHWNYIKTKGCTIIGEAPTDSIKRISDIFNNGITFWKNASEVGNYSLDNAPV